MLTRTRTITAEPADALALLRLLHLASPALPIGAFHFSQGLEYAVDTGWVHDEASALEWIDGIASASIGTLDLPVLARLHAAWTRDDSESVIQWNEFLIACRETSELRLEDRHLGSALLRVLRTFGIEAGSIPESGFTYATSFALAAARWRLDAGATMNTYAWAWAENQVIAAVKLVPLGQTAGQRMLHALAGRLASLTASAQIFTDSDIGVAAISQAVASSRHE